MSKTTPKDGTVITASYQTNGKGQYGRTWEANKGKNILLSIILQPHKLIVNDIFMLNICISLAVQNFVSRYTDKIVKIKWPNDIYIENKKVAGLLIHNQISGKTISNSVIGVGININQVDFDVKNANPTSLAILANSNFNIKNILPQLYNDLNKYYHLLNSKRYNLLRNQYLEHLYQINILSRFRLADSSIMKGTIVSIQENGALTIESNGSRKSYMMHEIKMIIP